MQVRDVVIKKIVEMSQEQVTKVLIFMAGMEAEHKIGSGNSSDQEFYVEDS